MTKWKHIWNKENRVHPLILDILIKANGFDTVAGKFDIQDWLKHVNNIFYKQLKLDKKDSIFEVGCGAGAFIYPLHLEGHEVGGIDYAEVLIDLVKKIISSKGFKTQEAIELDTSKKYDIVFSHSVFHYFQNIAYAEKVIDKMLKKAHKKVAILDINDIDKKDIYHTERSKCMGQKIYEKKYKGLSHLFYEKEWFRDIAKQCNLNIKIKKYLITQIHPCVSMLS